MKHDFWRLLIAALLVSGGTCVGQSPCQAGPLQNIFGKSCMLGPIVFEPGALASTDGDLQPYFQPDVNDPNNPGFIITCCVTWSSSYGGTLFWRYGEAPLIADSTCVPILGCIINGGGFDFGYYATLPCIGTLCDTIVAPVISAVKAQTTSYSVDLSGFPADVNGWGLSSAVVNATGFATCSDGTIHPSITTTAGEQLDVLADSNNIVWGNSTSAALPCVQRHISGQVHMSVAMQGCSTVECATLSTASLDGASFYFHIATIQEFSNGDTGGGPSQPLPRILTADTMFSSFSNKLQASQTGFDLVSNFTLGPASDGIKPLAEPMSLQVGSYGVTLPAQSFHLTSKGYYVYQGTINGENIQVQIVPGTAATYTLKAAVSGTTLITIQNPAGVGLTIGNDFAIADTPLSK